MRVKINSSKTAFESFESRLICFWEQTNLKHLLFKTVPLLYVELSFKKISPPLILELQKWTPVSVWVSTGKFKTGSGFYDELEFQRWHCCQLLSVLECSSSVPLWSCRKQLWSLHFLACKSSASLKKWILHATNGFGVTILSGNWAIPYLKCAPDRFCKQSKN